ncbi:MAG: hypothetical protein MZV70_23745 [Desulfobacterales bacterium]|nr:hypothetical protein [Desulfobacterales bacterium]
MWPSREKVRLRLKTASQEEADYSKKLVVEAITGLGQKIDEQWKKKLINNAYLHRFATDNNFWYVAVLNRDGNAIYQSNPLKTNMLTESDLDTNGRKATTIELLEKIRIKQGIGYVGLRRKDGSGTVVINLDKAGLRYWSIKVAVERAINKMGEGHGIAYMQIFNDQQELLSVMGKPIHGLINKDFDRQEILKGKKEFSVEKLRLGTARFSIWPPHSYWIKRLSGLSESALSGGRWTKLSLKTGKIFLFSCCWLS